LLRHPPENIDLCLAFAVQEEVGLRGAKVAAHAFAPDLAVAIDSTPANDLPAHDDEENVSYNTRLGFGPAIYTADAGTLNDPRLIGWLSRAGDRLGIPYQFRQPGGGGTDAGAIHRQLAGIPTVSVSVPHRYSHTAVSLARIDDWKHTLALLHAALTDLTPALLARPRCAGMSGWIALVGSGEYLPVMRPVDARLLESTRANGRVPRAVCLPTAAGREGQGSWGRWMRMGEQHFRALGAEVLALPVIDRASADDLQHARAVEQADLIYFSGGDPRYLHETLDGSRVWESVGRARERGAVLAGCSAGAMVLARELPDLRRAGLGTVPAFGLVPFRAVLPHFDRWKAFQALMLAGLRARLEPGETVLGVDEDTALIGRPAEAWQVHGRRSVSVITRDEVRVLHPGESLELSN